MLEFSVIRSFNSNFQKNNITFCTNIAYEFLPRACITSTRERVNA